MKKQYLYVVCGSIGLIILIGIVSWLSQPRKHQSLTVDQPVQQVLGWTTTYATYVPNQANSDYDPGQKVVTVIKIDRDERTVSYDAKTQISNFPELLAGLPNVAPVATFDGIQLVCTLDPELTYPLVGVFVFRCENPPQ